MNFRSLSYRLVTGALCVAAAFNTVLAEDQGPLKVLLASITLSGKSVTMRFNVVNSSTSTIYVRNFSFEKAEDFILNSGDSLQYPRVSGIQECRHDLNNCLGQSGADINEYSSIEPSKSAPLNLTFFTQKPINQNDNVSGFIALVARFQNSGGSPGQPTLKRFAFQNKSINRN